MRQGFIKEDSRMDIRGIMNKKDFEGIITFEKHKKNKDKDTHSNLVIDRLYKSKIKKIDKNLNEL